jgi:hypothetical protein
MELNMETIFGDSFQPNGNGDADHESEQPTSPNPEMPISSPVDAAVGSGSSPTKFSNNYSEPFRQYIFSGDDNRKEIALKLALSGQSLDEAMKSLEDFYAAKQNGVESLYNHRIEKIGDELTENREKVNERRIKLSQSGETLARTEAAVAQLQNEEPLLQQQENDTWHELLHHRFIGAQQFFESQQRRLESGLAGKRRQTVADIEAQIEIDQKLFDIKKQDYEINTAEFKRRVDVCLEEKKLVEDKLDNAMVYADNLKKIGVTRTTATFLFVAGFISLAGVGSVISYLLTNRQPGEDILSRLVQNVGRIADSMLPAQLGQFAPVLKPFVFVLLLLVFLATFYGLVRLMDWLVHRFDSEYWMGQASDSDSSRVPRTIGDQFTGFASSALSISSQLSTLLPFSVERQDYARLLASFPYLFLGGVIVFLFSSGGNVSGLTTSYIGVIFALLATSVSVLYVTKIIEPRWDSASKTIEGEKRSVAFARLNRELTGLFALMVLSLLLAAFMPEQATRWAYLNSSQTKLIVWGCIALFMSLSSLGLAYGIIQRGIFKDIDHLIRRRNDYRLLIERFSMRPTVGGAGHGKGSAHEVDSAQYTDLIDRLEDHRLWYELNEVFGNDFEFENPPADDALRSAWFSFRRTKGGGRPAFLSFRTRREAPRQPKSTDFSFAPEQAKAFVEARQRLSRNGQKKAYLQNEEAIARIAVTEASTELERLEDQLSKVAIAKADLESRFERELSDLIMERERELMIFRGDFAFGVVARSLLKDEDILPHFHPMVVT